MSEVTETETGLLLEVDLESANLISTAIIAYGWWLLDHGTKDTDPVLKKISDLAGAIDQYVQEED